MRSKLTKRQTERICLLILAAGAALLVLPKSFVLNCVGMGVIALAAVFLIVFYRCPHCGRFLYHRFDKYCPHCGEPLEK